MSDMLPMVVWLRGDEPQCEDFTLDADQVMALLGIRRSRLTQISGRELRVGRMRKGRYVSPVYRQSDVEAYREWTRPTASHLKSSTVLKDAAAQLESGLEATIETTLAALRQTALDVVRHTAEETERLIGELRVSETSVHRKIDLAQGRIGALEGRTASLGGQLDKMAALETLLARDTAEMGGLLRIQREEARQSGAVLAEQLAAIAAELAALKDGLAERAQAERAKAAPRPKRSAALVARQAARIDRERAPGGSDEPRGLGRHQRRLARSAKP